MFFVLLGEIVIFSISPVFPLFIYFFDSYSFSVSASM